MQIFPAIDIKDGKVVRLTQGDYENVNVYSENPKEIALSFAAKGAKNLHVVDLDGARDGALANFKTITSIVNATDMFVQVGGGIRDEIRINKYLDAGVSRVILGTAAVENFEFLTAMVDTYGEKIAVGVDARDEKIAVKGWREITDVSSVEFCAKLSVAGVKTIIYTDISKDGAMSGTNLEIYRRLSKEISCNIVASGGISSMSEIEELKHIGTYAAILGKAIYQGVISLEEALKVCL